MTRVMPRTKPGKFVYLSQLAKCFRYAEIALGTESSGPRSSPGRDHYVVFLGKTLDCHSTSLTQLRCVNGYQ